MTHYKRPNLPYHPPVRVMNHHYQAASTSSQVPLSADVPDLYYEQGYRTPSVTSSDMLSTPPRHSQTPWMQEYHNDNSVSYMSSWQWFPTNPSQSKRPTVAPIDTNLNLNWSVYDSSSKGEINGAHQVAGHGAHRSTYSYTFVDNDPTIGLMSITAMPDSSALPALLPPSSISDASTPSQTPNQPPLKLHQPRPSRRIPIISLSDLASACDDPLTNHVQDPKRNASEEALSAPPLSLDFKSMLSLPAVDAGNTQQLKYMLYPTSDVYSPTYGVGFDGHSGKAILCNCGCMESYTFR